MNLPKLLTEKQAASCLGMTDRTLSQQRRLGLISFIRVGRSARYTEAFIREYLDNITRSANVQLHKHDVIIVQNKD